MWLSSWGALVLLLRSMWVLSAPEIELLAPSLAGGFFTTEMPEKPERNYLNQGGLLSSVTQSCLTLCDPMDCSTPGLPVHHQHLELTQTHVHSVGDAIQPSHPLLLPSIIPSIRVFSSESVLRIRSPEYWSFSFSISPSNEYSGLISFRMDWLDLLAVQGLSRVFSKTTVQKHQFFSARLSL